MSNPRSGFPAADDRTEFERLHSATLWLPFLSTFWGFLLFVAVSSFLFPAAVISFLGFWFFLVPAALINVARYLSFGYRIGGEDLQIREGILWRQERRIPLSRIQNIEIQQKLLHRMFGVARVEITTAGKEKTEALLDVVTLAQAERVKESAARVEPRSEMGALERNAPERTLLELSVRELVLGALTTRAVATVLALAGALLYFGVVLSLGSIFGEVVDLELFDPFGRWAETLNPLRGTVAEPVVSFLLDETLFKTVLIILGGLLISVARFAGRFANFRLARTGSVLTRTFGLVNLQTRTVVPERVQALKIEEGLLRRSVGLADIWVDSGGDRESVDDKKNREVFVPVVAKARTGPLLRAIFPGLVDPEPDWRRVAPRSVNRGSRLGWILLTAAMLWSLLPLGWYALVLLPGYPLIYFLNLQWYRNRGYWLDGRYLISRKGWFNRETLYIPIQNIQNVQMTQSPFDRRWRLAALEVDIAGQANTGGGPRIRHLDEEDARRIQFELIQAVR